MNEKKLSVRLHGDPIGMLEQLPTGKMVFSYDESVTQPISISMPVREEPYADLQCEAFFGGLLPESETVKKIIGKRFGISHNNSFALLKSIGYDCAGAISFHQINEPVTLQHSFPLEGKHISEDELYDHIKLLPKNPLFLGFDDLKLSLAGVQDKAAVCLIENQIAMPLHGCPTTHILKPAISAFANTVENEYFCLKIAKHIGLNVPNVEIRQAKDIIYLLVERYDRRVQNNYIERIHQEDFCQASGILSARKYQNEGGPGFQQCFALLQDATQPAVDRNMLASGIVFNYLISNMDAHGKNFSLLLDKNTQIRLAPFYDLLCTKVYPELTSKMAMKIGSKYSHNEVLPRHWEQLCHDINYRYPALKQLIHSLSESIMNAAQLERMKLLDMKRNVSTIDKMIKVFEQTISRTFKQFAG